MKPYINFGWSLAKHRTALEQRYHRLLGIRGFAKLQNIVMERNRARIGLQHMLELLYVQHRRDVPARGNK